MMQGGRDLVTLKGDRNDLSHMHPKKEKQERSDLLNAHVGVNGIMLAGIISFTGPLSGALGSVITNPGTVPEIRSGCDPQSSGCPKTT